LKDKQALKNVFKPRNMVIPAVITSCLMPWPSHFWLTPWCDRESRDGDEFSLHSCLNHDRFVSYLEETDSRYGHTLSFCLQSKTFWNKSPQSNLLDPLWFTRLYFLMDVTIHLNTLNLKLQGTNKSSVDLFKKMQIPTGHVDRADGD
jgi:hypothetical protein